MKLSEKIQAEIQRLEQELEPLNVQLEGKIRKFASESLPAAAATWMDGEVKRRVESNAARIHEIGVEKLGQLKSELSELKRKLPEHARDAIAEEQEWPHREKQNPNSSSYGSSRTDYFHNVFRTVINNLGSLLAKHDLIKEPAGYSPSWRPVGANRFEYAINPGFDLRNFPVLTEYEETRKKQRQTAGELTKKRQELVTAKAGELWDSI